MLLCCCSYCSRNSPTGSDFVYLSNWSHGYCSAVIDAAFMCLLFIVIVFLVLVTHIMQDLLL